MILIAAIDDEYGMMFNHRRQSQDRILRDKILSLTGSRCLWMNSYTKKQFTEIMDSHRICVDDDFPGKMPSGDYCFAENVPLALYESKIEKIYLFKWNRKYPADFYFDIDINNGGWKLVSAEEFAGYSHEKITLEVYER